MFAKNLLPVLAAVGFAAADSGVCTTTTTVASAAEATALGSSCQTVKGDVYVDPSTADTSFDFGSLEQITGKLVVVNNNKINSIQADSLGSIGGALTLTNLSGLGSLGFSELTSVGYINFTSLAGLSTLGFSITKANNITISDTRLSSLTGIDVDTCGDININNNNQLFEFTSNMKNLTGTLHMDSNGNSKGSRNVSVSLPSLTWAYGFDVHNVSSFSAPSLVAVNSSGQFQANFFTSFMAPNLSSSAGILSFIDNSALTNISMPGLTSTGALLIANNTQLLKINGFNALKSVNGDVKLRGNFTEIDFPALTNVKGAFNVASTSDISSSCSTFSQLGSSKVIQGKVTCTSNDANANNDTSTSTSGGGSSSSNSSSVATSMQFNGAVLGLAVVGAVAQLW